MAKNGFVFPPNWEGSYIVNPHKEGNKYFADLHKRIPPGFDGPSDAEMSWPEDYGGRGRIYAKTNIEITKDLFESLGGKTE